MAATLQTDDPVLVEFAELIGHEGPVSVRGGGTRFDVGGELAAGTRVVEAPIGVVSYAPAEMTVTVRAGTPVADLEAALGVHGQRSALPMRGGTVGGAVAVGEDHVEVLGRGRVRDSVLQVRYVSAEGRLITGGGPVVKNVSGFNLPKLLTGSLGTLAAMAEFVLRVNPIPAASVWLRSDDVDPFEVAGVVLRASAILSDRSSVWVLLEGHEPDVVSERGRLERIGTFTEVEGPPPLPEHRWSVAPSELRTLDRERTGPAVLSLGVGRVWAGRPAPPPAVDPVVAAISERMKANFDPTGRLNPGRRP